LIYAVVPILVLTPDPVDERHRIVGENEVGHAGYTGNMRYRIEKIGCGFPGADLACIRPVQRSQR
jgi:hypothetical protein